MGKKAIILGLLTASLFAAKASAITVFDNGPISGNTDAWLIYGTTVTDSFSLSGPATVTQAEVGLWTSNGDVPKTVDWSIGSTAYGSDISSGTSSLTNAFQFNNSYGYDIYESTFSLSGALGDGTYWLTLQNATSTQSQGVFWDENDGASLAQDSTYGPIGSESFQLGYVPSASTAATTAVPEPVSATLLGLAGTSLAGYILKRRKSVAGTR